MAPDSRSQKGIMFQELPAGTGYADIGCLPKKDSIFPALVIELKRNRSARGAMEQMKDRRHPQAIKGYSGDILEKQCGEREKGIGEGKDCGNLFKSR